MRLDLQELGTEPLTVELPLTLTALTDNYGEPIEVRKAQLTTEARRIRGGVELTGRLVAQVALSCSRCAETFDLGVDRGFRLLAVESPASVAFGSAEKPDFDEDGLVATEQGHVDLAAVATEQIYLDLPLKPVCRPDCRSLCPACGANRNRIECGCQNQDVDPRFGALVEFRKRMGQS